MLKSLYYHFPERFEQFSRKVADPSQTQLSSLERIPSLIVDSVNWLCTHSGKLILHLTKGRSGSHTPFVAAKAGPARYSFIPGKLAILEWKASVVGYLAKALPALA